jgi:hypothetical protein
MSPNATETRMAFEVVVFHCSAESYRLNRIEQKLAEAGCRVGAAHDVRRPGQPARGDARAVVMFVQGMTAMQTAVTKGVAREWGVPVFALQFQASGEEWQRLRNAVRTSAENELVDESRSSKKEEAKVVELVKKPAAESGPKVEPDSAEEIVRLYDEEARQLRVNLREALDRVSTLQSRVAELEKALQAATGGKGRGPGVAKAGVTYDQAVGDRVVALLREHGEMTRTALYPLIWPGRSYGGRTTGAGSEFIAFMDQLEKVGRVLSRRTSAGGIIYSLPEHAEVPLPAKPFLAQRKYPPNESVKKSTPKAAPLSEVDAAIASVRQLLASGVVNEAQASEMIARVLVGAGR